MGSVSELLTAVPLHQRPDLLEACAELINEEWKKSQTARVSSLQKSADSFPLCLVLIQTRSSAEAAADTRLLGHARLSRVLGRPESLFVETVVVARALRGQGYGRKLMEATERYARARGFRCLHLTTHDKQQFYAHLGYAVSEPVQSMGFMSSLVPMDFLLRFSSPSPLRPGSTASPLNSRTSGANPPPPSAPPAPCTATVHPPPPSSAPPAPCTAAVHPPPPPPPSSAPPAPCTAAVHPPAPSLSAPTCPLNSPPAIPSSLPLPPPPAGGPPPPPPLPPPAGVLPPSPPPGRFPLPGQPGSPGPIACSLAGVDPCGQTLLETPYRDLRGLPIFWMKKDI